MESPSPQSKLWPSTVAEAEMSNLSVTITCREAPAAGGSDEAVRAEGEVSLLALLLASEEAAVALATCRGDSRAYEQMRSPRVQFTQYGRCSSHLRRTMLVFPTLSSPHTPGEIYLLEYDGACTQCSLSWTSYEAVGT